MDRCNAVLNKTKFQSFSCGVVTYVPVLFTSLCSPLEWWASSSATCAVLPAPVHCGALQETASARKVWPKEVTEGMKYLGDKYREMLWTINKRQTCWAVCHTLEWYLGRPHLPSDLETLWTEIWHPSHARQLKLAHPSLCSNCSKAFHARGRGGSLKSWFLRDAQADGKR